MNYLTEKEMLYIIKLIKKSHINQLTSIFNYIIYFGYKNKLNDKDYIKFLKSINRI